MQRTRISDSSKADLDELREEVSLPSRLKFAFPYEKLKEERYAPFMYTWIRNFQMSTKDFYRCGCSSTPLGINVKDFKELREEIRGRRMPPVKEVEPPELSVLFFPFIPASFSA